MADDITTQQYLAVARALSALHPNRRRAIAELAKVVSSPKKKTIANVLIILVALVAVIAAAAFSTHPLITTLLVFAGIGLGALLVLAVYRLW